MKTKSYVTKKDNGFTSILGLDKVEFDWSSSRNKIKVKRVIYNDPATIVYFTDGSRVVVKKHKNDKFDKQTGLLMCIAKKFLGDDFHHTLREHVPDYKKEQSKVKTVEIKFADFFK